MGNQQSGSKGRVILSDGTVHEYDTPLTVAELMLDHPQQVVVEFHKPSSSPSSNNKRPRALPADKKLDMDKVYLMLPMRRGKPPALSPEDARKLIFAANSVLASGSFLSSVTGLIPVFARICGTSVAGDHMGQSIVLQKKKKKRDGGVVRKREEVKEIESFSPEIMEGGSEFLSRQLSGKGWKPSLEPIKEKVAKKKIDHWLSF